MSRSSTRAYRSVGTPAAGTVLATITSAAGKALSKPTSITVDGTKIYVSDTNNDRVLVYTN